jgi:hypothetical protein
MGQTDGRTPLHAASESGHVDAVVALVGAGAAVNKASVSVDGVAIRMFARMGCWYAVVMWWSEGLVCYCFRWFACDE